MCNLGLGSRLGSGLVSVRVRARGRVAENLKVSSRSSTLKEGQVWLGIVEVLIKLG